VELEEPALLRGNLPVRDHSQRRLRVESRVLQRLSQNPK
jgi:hypothetical protein